MGQHPRRDQPDMNPFKPFLAELKARHEARTGENPDFVFTRDRLALAQELMHETTVSLNEEKRRAQQADIEKRQLALQNALRQARARNRWPSWRRKRKPRRTRKWTSPSRKTTPTSPRADASCSIIWA